MFVKSHYLFILLLSFHFRRSHQVSCRDEKNKEVDWYVNYKLPKIEDYRSDENVRKGRAYAYITAPGSTSWKLSDKSIISGGSMLEKTMENFYSNKEGLSYLFYNDEPPTNISGTSVGHLKGVVVFDGDTGFWLVHSIPKFTDVDGYEYPKNALENGQSILCVTFKTKELNEISNQLLYSHPNIYAYKITDDVKTQLDNNARTLFTDNPKFVRKEPFTRMTTLKSLRNNIFVSFAKDNQYRHDIYSDLIATGLKANLLVETWRKGSGGILPPSCQSKYSVLDIVSINMTITSRGNSKSIFFKYTEDHSKWAIAEDGRNWICVGDMNRMASQARRGGGALCFVSSPVRNAYRSIISDTDKCPTSARRNLAFKLKSIS